LSAARLLSLLGGAALLAAAAIAARALGEGATHPRYNSRLFALTRLTHPALANPVSLQFGPDGALYVSTREGLLHRFRLRRARNPHQFEFASAETIDLIRRLPNHDDRGHPDPHTEGRLLTGFTVTGTAAHPIVYASHSDPRLQSPHADTNSGALSRLELSAGRWIHTPLVRGLPRSRSDHAPHGVAYDPASHTLYVSLGANTNLGAPSPEFHNLPEYPLSGAILSVSLSRLTNPPYDLPTPLGRLHGGESGRNAATLPPNSPLALHATGLRNAYDLALTPEGLLTIDNGANAGYGGPPSPDNPFEAAPGDSGPQRPNCLFLIARPGLFLGHPNPLRGETGPPTLEPLGCVLTSTNGLVLYSPRHGRWEHKFLAARLDGAVLLYHLHPKSNRLVLREPILTNVPGMVLDVWAQNHAEPFPGSIWAAAMDDNALYALDPLAPDFSDARLGLERIVHGFYETASAGAIRTRFAVLSRLQPLLQR
jgi:glucose/arabinose dehydrogenase